MAHTTPSVSNGQLTYFQHDIPYTFPVGSDSWWQWLKDGVPSFRVQAVAYPFTVRREQKMYWRAWCTHEKHKYSLYVGKTEMLTLYRLHEVAEELHKRIAPDPSSLEQSTPSLATISPLETTNVPLNAVLPEPQPVPTLPQTQQGLIERPFFAYDATLMQRLTAREVEVMSFVAEAMTNVQIAKILCISISTVKTHVSSICEKLELANRIQIIVYVQRLREQKMVMQSQLDDTLLVQRFSYGSDALRPGTAFKPYQDAMHQTSRKFFLC
jgi:DNA-binding CsgD family transcriptional regulator